MKIEKRINVTRKKYINRWGLGENQTLQINKITRIIIFLSRVIILNVNCLADQIKTQDPITFHLRKLHLNGKDKHTLKVQGQKKVF
jgi:hypothetical protein